MSQPRLQDTVFLLMLTALGQKEKTSSQGTGRLQAFCVLHVRGAQPAKGFRKEICSQGSRQDGGWGSGFINVLRAGALSAISGEKESHKPWETEKGGGYLQSSQLRSALMTPSPTTGYSILPAPRTTAAEGPRVRRGSTKLICLPRWLFISPASEAFHISIFQQQK